MLRTLRTPQPSLESIKRMTEYLCNKMQNYYKNWAEYTLVLNKYTKNPLDMFPDMAQHAAKYLLDGTANNAAVWGQNARNNYFSQPVPDNFYTGDSKPVEFIGQLRDYFAWTWGDALFVTIDPYWY